MLDGVRPEVQKVIDSENFIVEYYKKDHENQEIKLFHKRYCNISIHYHELTTPCKGNLATKQNTISLLINDDRAELVPLEKQYLISKVKKILDSKPSKIGNLELLKDIDDI